MSSEYPPPPPTQPPPTYGQQPYGQPAYGQQPYGQQPYGQPELPEPGFGAAWSSAPRDLRPVLLLLAVNLALSLILTVVTIVLRRSIVDYQLDHRHITDSEQRRLLRDSLTSGIVGRVGGNIVISIVYVFLVRALVRGRRWAYRRVVWLSAVGIVGLLLLQVSPYPVWMRVEQLVQALILAALLYSVLRPAVKAHFDPQLPGRNVRRFGR